MIAYPLIHSRTFNIDYPPAFLFRPSDFNASMISESNKYIRASTKDVELYKGFRRVVFPVGKYVVLGISGIAREIAEELDFDCKNFVFKDSGNRDIRIFVGYCILRKDLTDNNVVPDITEKELFNTFYKYVSSDKVWNCKEEKFYSSREISINAKKAEPIPEADCRGIRNQENDHSLWLNYTLCSAQNNDKSLCTNLQNEGIIFNTPFSEVTTSLDPSNIKRRANVSASGNNKKYENFIKRIFKKIKRFVENKIFAALHK